MRWIRDLQSVLTALCGIFLILSFFNLHPSLPYLAIACGSYFALSSAWESLRERSLDVNFLMVFAAVGAILVGHPDDAAGLLFLFSLSSTLEAFAMARTKSAIEGLIKLRPAEAVRLLHGSEEKVPVEALCLGDRIRVKPFEQLPADGTVLQGVSSLDQSAMTGESVPVAIEPGSRVLAGTQNLEGMIVLQVDAEVGNSTLEKIVDLVRDAQENKASGERISTWFGQKYTFFVIFAFLLSWGLRAALGQAVFVGQDSAFYQSLILLVALSPCAVVISTPATTLSALAWSARNGVLVRGGEFIESIGRVNTAALDKTGTLTAGKPQLVEICVCTGVPEAVGASGSLCVDEHACWDGGEHMSEESQKMLRMAAIAEQYSDHPIAQAIVKAARERGLDVPEADDQQTHSGMGVTARFGGEVIKVGQRRFFEQEGTLDADFALHAAELQRKGMTVAILEWNGRMAALGLRDEPKPGVGPVLDQLRSLGVDHLIMITGDTPETAEAVAKELKLNEFHGGLLPTDKTKIIEQLEDSGRPTLMVGDGVNDAPALARATVGVAMGGLGSDIALNAADIVLMQDKLERIPQMVRLGRRTNGIIKANLFFATGMIVSLAISSLFFRLPLPFAVIGHEGSTVLVILNGLRLLKGP
ncbi:MAG: cation-translocating P-type ATPase [Fimbriimonadales bacterium]